MSLTFTWGGDDILAQATTGTTIYLGRITPRPFKKAVTRHKVEIPGRKGSWDFGGGVERDYTIMAELFIKGDTSANVMACAEALATFLKGKEELIFSDAPTTVHVAEVYDEIPMDYEMDIRLGSITVVFECDA